MFELSQIGNRSSSTLTKSFLLQIILWGRTEKCLKETTEEIRMMGTECHYFICDVGNREEVYRQAKAVREKVGRAHGGAGGAGGSLLKGLRRDLLALHPGRRVQPAGSGSAPREWDRGEGTASACTKGGSDWILMKTFSWKGL